MFWMELDLMGLIHHHIPIHSHHQLLMVMWTWLFIIVLISQFRLRVAYEQALWGAVAAGWEIEGELATTSLEFEYLHRKRRCEILIARDDIGNDVITLSLLFQCLFTFQLFLLYADWWKSDISDNREPQGNWRRISNSRDTVASSLSFSRSAPEHPGELVRRFGLRSEALTHCWQCWLTV